MVHSPRARFSVLRNDLLLKCLQQMCDTYVTAETQLMSNEDKTEPLPQEEPSQNGRSESPGSESPEPEAEEDGFETDALRLIAYAADALRDDSDLPAFSIDRARFSGEGSPEMLFLQREEGEITWAVWSGRSEMKHHVRDASTGLYKRLRRIMMSYEMGEEIPVFTHGRDGNVGVAIVTLDQRPEIKSP